MEIVEERLSNLKPHNKNRNQHGKDQIKRLADLISHYGFRAPIIVSKRSGHIVAGHARLEAAKLAGLKTAPVIYQDFKNEEEEYGYLISDNSIQDWSDIDLSSIHRDIQDMEAFDLELLGFKNFKLEPDPKDKTDTEVCPTCQRKMKKR